MSAFLLSVEWQLRTTNSPFLFHSWHDDQELYGISFGSCFRQAGREDRHSFYGYSCSAHISLQNEQGRSLVQFLLSPQFRDRVCFMLISIPSAFGSFACVTLPEKDILGGSHKGVKRKILVPVFHVFPNFTDVLNFNAQYIWSGWNVASCSEQSTCGTVWPTVH